MATLKQKAAIENVVENGGIVSKAMIDAGYSEKTAKTPQKLTESKAWLEIMEEHLPDSKLAEKHEELLNHEEGNIQVKALDMAYKLKGSYAPEKSQAVVANIDLSVKDNPKTRALAEEYEKKLKESILE